MKVGEKKQKMESKRLRTYEEVANEYRLEGYDGSLFVLYMKKRWPDSEEEKCLYGYASEWAERFKKRTAWVCSDSEGQRILEELAPGLFKVK